MNEGLHLQYIGRHNTRRELSERRGFDGLACWANQSVNGSKKEIRGTRVRSWESETEEGFILCTINCEFYSCFLVSFQPVGGLLALAFHLHFTTQIKKEVSILCEEFPEKILLIMLNNK
jgi:hypothetical protein